MKVREKLYPAGETAKILRDFIGTIRSWDDALADMRSGKTNVYGNVLIPAVLLHDGRAWRPWYALSDIKVFIKAVHASTERAVVNQEPQGIVMEFDDAINWRTQKLPGASALGARI